MEALSEAQRQVAQGGYDRTCARRFPLADRRTARLVVRTGVAHAVSGIDKKTEEDLGSGYALVGRERIAKSKIRLRRAARHGLRRTSHRGRSRLRSATRPLRRRYAPV